MEPKRRKMRPKNGSLHDKILYYKEDNYRGYLALVFIAANLLLLGISILAMGTLADTTGMTTKDIIWRGLSIMLDPGNLEPDPSLLITLVLSLITIIGMICFSGGMVAFLSSMLNDHLEKVREGGNSIHYKHFTLFLGWNHRGLDLLKAFMSKKSQDSVTDFVVILSKNNGPDLREHIMKQLREYLKNHEEAHALRLLVRTGDPGDFGSLLTVDYQNADEVFILGDEDDADSDFGVERIFFSLTRAYTRQSGGRVKKIRETDVDIVVEALYEDTAEMINHFRPRKEGIRTFATEAFSMTRLLGRKYAEMLPRKDRITICSLNEAVPFMLEALKEKTEGGREPMPGVLLLVEESQREEARELYENSSFASLFVQEPVIVQKRAELSERIVRELKSGCRSILVLSPYDYMNGGWEHRNFEIWAELEDKIETDPELTRDACNSVLFEMLDETDAQIIDGFDFGRCIISSNMISEYMLELCKKNGILAETTEE